MGLPEEEGITTMIVVFWGPVHGQVCTTSNLMAVSTVMAMTNNLKVLLTHTHLERSTLENAFSSLRSDAAIRKDSGGISAIERLAYAGRLSPEHIRDNSEKIMKDRLDLLPGSGMNDQTHFVNALPTILEASRALYKLAYIDVSSGSRNDITNMVLENADLVVVNLNQNLSVTDQFFKATDWPSALKDKPKLYCIGSYQYRSKMTAAKIISRYKLPKNSVGVVPYSPSYMDSQNNNNIMDFFLRAEGVKQKMFDFNEDAYFMDSVKKFGNVILNKLEIPVIREEE
jgi:hypothetical protein